MRASRRRDGEASRVIAGCWHRGSEERARKLERDIATMTRGDTIGRAGPWRAGAGWCLAWVAAAV